MPFLTSNKYPLTTKIMTMKNIYQRPEIWVEELKMESPLFANTVTDIVGKSGTNTIFGYGGGGNGGARAGENDLWDDEEEESDWNHL